MVPEAGVDGDGGGVGEGDLRCDDPGRPGWPRWSCRSGGSGVSTSRPDEAPDGHAPPAFGP